MIEAHDAALARQEFARGWRIVVAGCLGVALGAMPIPYAMLSHLTIPLQTEFGWARGEMHFAITIYAVMLTLMAPVYGYLLDTIGARKVAIGALIFFSLTFTAIAATTSNIIVFYALWGLCGILGSASTPISWSRGIAGWFFYGRGLALGIILAGSGITIFFLNIFMPTLIANHGWRTAMVVMGLSPLVIALPVVVAFFHDPEAKPDMPQETRVAEATAPRPTLRATLRDFRFWLILAAVMLIGLAQAGFYVNAIPLMVDKGFSTVVAGGVISSMGVSIIIGRVFTGYFLDRYWAPLVAFPVITMPVIGCVVCMSATVSLPMAILSAWMFGIAAGAESSIIAYLTARYFGLASYGKIYALLFAGYSIASALSSPVYGMSYDIFGSYNAILSVSPILSLAAAVLLLRLGPYPAAAGPRR